MCKICLLAICKFVSWCKTLYGVCLCLDLERDILWMKMCNAKSFVHPVIIMVIYYKKSNRFKLSYTFVMNCIINYIFIMLLYRCCSSSTYSVLLLLFLYYASF